MEHKISYLDDLRHIPKIGSVGDSFIFMSDTFCVKMWIDWSGIDPIHYPSEFGNGWLSYDINSRCTPHVCYELRELAIKTHVGLLYEAKVYQLITQNFDENDNFIHFIDHFSLSLNIVPEYIQKIINKSSINACDLKHISQLQLHL